MNEKKGRLGNLRWVRKDCHHRAVVLPLIPIFKKSGSDSLNHRRDIVVIACGADHWSCQPAPANKPGASFSLPCPFPGSPILSWVLKGKGFFLKNIFSSGRHSYPQAVLAVSSRNRRECRRGGTRATVRIKRLGSLDREQGESDLKQAERYGAGCWGKIEDSRLTREKNKWRCRQQHRAFVFAPRPLESHYCESP